MHHKEFILLLLEVLSGLAIAKQSNLNRKIKTHDVRKNVLIKPKNFGHHKVQQGECMEGWVDASSVGLGCVLADVSNMGVEQPVAESNCRDFGENGRLVEIENRQQMSFLESMLELLEEELGIFDGFIWYWIGIKLFTEFCENGNKG